MSYTHCLYFNNSRFLGEYLISKNNVYLTSSSSIGCCPFLGGDYVVVDSLFGVSLILYVGYMLGPSFAT